MKEKLIEMVEKGMSVREIKRELGIKSRATLRGMYYDALVRAGRIKDIGRGSTVKREPRKRRALTIGKRGSILLSKLLLVNQLGFKEGDKFSVARRGGSIILKKMV